MVPTPTLGDSAWLEVAAGYASRVNLFEGGPLCLMMVSEMKASECFLLPHSASRMYFACVRAAADGRSKDCVETEQCQQCDRFYKGKPMVNSPFIRPYLLGGWWPWGGYLRFP